MRARSRVVGTVTMALVACSRPPVGTELDCHPCPGQAVALPPPAGPKAPGLPDLPSQSPRNASYSIDARLDPERHTLQGSLVLEWRNTTGQPQSTLPFHLYWNAFRNTLSTAARGEGRRPVRPRASDGTRGFGYLQIASVRQVGDGGETDLTPTLGYVQPDDRNTDDRTVAQIVTPVAVAPDATARFKIDWTAQMPYGDT